MEEHAPERHAPERPAPERPLPERPAPDGPDGDRGPSHLAVRPWWDPALAVGGYDPRSAYAERFWLGVIGPSTLLLLRRFARGLDDHPTGFRMSVVDTGRAMGLGSGTGRRAPVSRTIDRACSFGLARRTGPDQVEVRTHLPRLTSRQLQRLPVVVQQAHRDWLVRATPEVPPAA